MQAWVILLRVVAVAYLVASLMRLLERAQSALAVGGTAWITAYLVDALATTLLVLLGFAVAAGLKHLQRLDYKLNVVGRSLRKAPYPSDRYADLAPVAPNWEELPDPLPYSYWLEKRIAAVERIGADDLAGMYKADMAKRGVRRVHIQEEI